MVLFFFYSVLLFYFLAYCHLVGFNLTPFPLQFCNGSYVFIGVASDIDGIDGGDKSGSEASCYEKFGAVIDEKLEAFFTKWGTGKSFGLVGGLSRSLF